MSHESGSNAGLQYREQRTDREKNVYEKSFYISGLKKDLTPRQRRIPAEQRMFRVGFPLISERKDESLLISPTQRRIFPEDTERAIPCVLIAKIYVILSDKREKMPSFLWH